MIQPNSCWKGLFGDDGIQSERFSIPRIRHNAASATLDFGFDLKRSSEMGIGLRWGVLLAIVKFSGVRNLCESVGVARSKWSFQVVRLATL